MIWMFLLLLALPQDNTPQIEKDIVYHKVGDRELKLDLRRMGKEKKQPVLILLHGGGWKSGDKKVAGMQGLYRRGFATIAVEYRLSGEAKYPAAIEDIQNAVRWVKKNAGKYNLDADRIGAVGHSAGGHLAALLGVKDDKDCRIQAVVSISGSHDLNDDGTGSQSHPREFIGGTPEEKPDAWKDAKCSTHVTADDPPVLMIHGDSDKTVPPTQAGKFLKRLKAKGVDAELILVENGGHFPLGKELKPSFDELMEKIRAFLDKHLKK